MWLPVMKKTLCSYCKKEINKDSPYFPFCSERCKLIDLGAWAMEKYKVPAQDLDDQIERNEDLTEKD